jgi:zinc protease
MTERWIFSNGLVVLYRADPTMPLAAATLLLRSGSRNEGPHEAGLCNFTMEMLLSGTRRKNAHQIADVIESVGGSLGAQASEDYSELDWLVPAVHAPKIIDLMVEVLTEPRWPALEITKQRDHILSDLKTRADVLFNVAYDAFRKHLFNDHAYARPIDGIDSAVRRFTRKDLAAWHATHLRPDQAIFSMTGPWPVAQARRMLGAALKKWKQPVAVIPSVSASHFSVPDWKPVTLTAAFQQAYFMSGTYAPALASQDILPLKAWNMILGGGMSSRLFVKLREERGLAYEISSFYPARMDGSAWAIYMGLPAERLPEAEQALTRLLEELNDKGPTSAELKQAKQLIQGTYVMDHQTRRRKAWYAAWWEFLHRPTDYDKKYLQRIQSLTLAEVRSAGQKLLAQSRLTVKVIPK